MKNFQRRNAEHFLFIVSVLRQKRKPDFKESCSIFKDFDSLPGLLTLVWEAGTVGRRDRSARRFLLSGETGAAGSKNLNKDPALYSANGGAHSFLCVLHKKSLCTLSPSGLCVKKSDIFLKKASFLQTEKNGTIKTRKRKARSRAAKGRAQPPAFRQRYAIRSGR